jgi:arabinose-5-phosphate isomerase
MLRGIFTDSDLARLFEQRRDALLDGPIRQVMTKNPTSVPHGSMLSDAVTIMAERRISELPVVDAAGKPVGMLDITDIVGLFPERGAAVLTQSSKSSNVPAPKNPALLKLRQPEDEDGA